MFNFKICFSNNTRKINTVLIKILVHMFVAKSEYAAEEINISQGAVLHTGGNVYLLASY